MQRFATSDWNLPLFLCSCTAALCNPGTMPYLQSKDIVAYPQSKDIVGWEFKSGNITAFKDFHFADVPSASLLK